MCRCGRQSAISLLIILHVRICMFFVLELKLLHLEQYAHVARKTHYALLSLMGAGPCTRLDTCLVITGSSAIHGLSCVKCLSLNLWFPYSLILSCTHVCYGFDTHLLCPMFHCLDSVLSNTVMLYTCTYMYIHGTSYDCAMFLSLPQSLDFVLSNSVIFCVYTHSYTHYATTVLFT